jgi:hypothetical protein
LGTAVNNASVVGCRENTYETVYVSVGSIETNETCGAITQYVATA